jgi:hypothetical protein
VTSLRAALMPVNNKMVVQQYSVRAQDYKQQIAKVTPGTPEFTPAFSEVPVTRSLVLYVCFVDRCLSFCTFSFGHCVVCSSSIYGF